MTLKETTLAGLDSSIAELRSSINNISDPEIRKELEKTLKNLIKAREKMNPSRHFSMFYFILLPFVIVFAICGIYYFSHDKLRSNR